ncbi:MAG: hypothetical protein JOZ58_03645, partial [Acetobacteraceae bacterium]|nr:hypothetical protein [Acetobacteraceae bacterium]
SRRMQEIAFATSLHKELEALEDFRDMCRRLVGPSPICRKLRELRFHRVSAAECVENLDRESALDTSWSFLTRLKECGRSAATGWLANNAPVKRAH